MATGDKEELIDFLERRAWNPVLEAEPSEYSGADRERLERMQKKTRAQVERYHAYGSAGQVRQEFGDDLTSRPAQKVDADLRALGLPQQGDVAEEFYGLADRLGVKPERGARGAHHAHPPHPWHKKKPEAREKAKRDLMRMARAGDEAALETLRTAPAKWARDYARELTEQRSRETGRR